MSLYATLHHRKRTPERRQAWPSGPARQRRLSLFPAVKALALAALLGNLSLPHQGPVAAATPPDPRFGVVEAYRASDLATKAGVGWERIIFYWNLLQPRSSADWNAGYLPDGVLQGELDQGREVVGLLISTPAWAGAGRPTDPPRNLHLPYDHPDNYWGQFVKRIVSHYRGRIDTWVIWNEPDIWDAANPGYTWGGSEADYYQLVKVAYQAAHAASPEAKILLAGLTYWWDQSYEREQYFRRLLQVASQDSTAPANNWYFDAAVLQLYNDPAGLRDVPLAFHRLMAERGFDKPIWINETNVAPWDDPQHRLTADWFRATQDEQASYLIQAFAYALTANVERLSVYKMLDDAELPPEAEPFGLVRADGSPRPAYTALQVALRYFAGVTSGEVERKHDVVRIALHRDGERVTVLWNQSPQRIQASVPAVAAEALLVEKNGQSRPLTPNRGSYNLELEPATYHTVPGMPDFYAIGGSPLLILERAGGQSQVLVSAESKCPGCDSSRARFFEATGHSVSGQWLTFYDRVGGLDVMGYPRSEVGFDPSAGQWVQYFQRAVLEWHSENPPAHQVLGRLLADEVYPGADEPLDSAPPSARSYAFFPASPDRPTGLGHGVGNYAPDGTYVGFRAFFEGHGGGQTFGYPKEEPKLRQGRWTQRFQAAVFEHHPENPAPYTVELELLGDELIAQRGLKLEARSEYWPELTGGAGGRILA